MNIVFIIIMVIGIALFAISFFMKAEEEKPVAIGLSKTEAKVSETKEKKNSKQLFEEAEEELENKSAANDAIEAAKKKAKEAVSGFDLHLNNDSSNQTVEELERDLLGGLDLSDTEGASVSEEEAVDTKKASQSSKGSSKKKNRSKKNNYPKNDRYDDLLYEDSEVKEAAQDVAEAIEEKTEKTEKSSSKNNKKGKKK